MTHDTVPEIRVLFQDAFLLAVEKPAGLHVHHTTMAGHERSLQHLIRDQLGLWVFPVHRLDRATSGVIVFALSAEVASNLGQDFQSHRVSKTYQAVVRGWTDDAGTIDHPVRDRRGHPREAVTRYRTLHRIEIPVPMHPHPSARYALVEVYPESGRRHQIRLHLKKLAHPIIGDTNHGDGRHNRLFRERFHLERMLLFATSLRLEHPVTGATLALDCPSDIDLTAIFPDPPTATPV